MLVHRRHGRRAGNVPRMSFRAPNTGQTGKYFIYRTPYRMAGDATWAPSPTRWLVWWWVLSRSHLEHVADMSPETQLHLFGFSVEEVVSDEK